MKSQSQGNRGRYWFELLTQDMDTPPTPVASIKIAEGILHHEKVSFITVIKDENNPYPRAREGEVGLLEGWGLGRLFMTLLLRIVRRK